MQRALAELSEMDELAAMRSPVHSLHPGAKLITTVVYILITLSYGKYDLPGLVPMVLWPVLMFSVSGVNVRTCFYKLRIVLPLVMAVGLFNPLFDREIMLTIGNTGISGGVISMITLMLKGVFCLMASFLLMATTKIDRRYRLIARGADITSSVALIISLSICIILSGEVSFVQDGRSNTTERNNIELIFVK